jgi:hypothetical protein
MPSLFALAGTLAAGSGSAAAQTQPSGATVEPQPAPPPPSGAFPPPPPRSEDAAIPAAPWPGGGDGQLPWAEGVSQRQQGNDVRRFSFTAAAGSGYLIGPGERSLALAYQLFRLGVGLDERLSLVFGFSGMGTSSVNPATGSDSWLKQNVWSGGLQVNLRRDLYVRGGLGLASVSETVGNRSFDGGNGLLIEGALGYELWQRRHVAIALELAGSTTHYARESWQTVGLQLAVSLF